MINKLYEKFKNYIKENYKFLVSLVFILFFFLYETPYVIYRPGGTINLNNRILMDDMNESEGTLSMSYVSMMKGNIPFVLLSFIIPNWDLVSSKDITYQDESIDDTISRDKVLLENGQDNAIFSAYTLANKNIVIKSKSMEVFYIDKRAQTNLKIEDKILKINDYEISELEDLQTYINSLEENEIVKLQVLRNDKKIDCEAKLFRLDDNLKMGVSIIEDYDYDLEPEIKIKNKESESGPSGGLMTALAIYNALTEEDITKGRDIVGTGTISKEGIVGEIGGIKYKLLGAERKKADIFLCPEENYEEAMQVKKDNNLKLEIIKVKTLEEAISFLQ